MTAGKLGVLHLSTHDLHGGAARAAYRLHQGLRQRAVASRMLVRDKTSDDPDVLLCARTPEPRAHRLWRKLAPYLDALPEALLRSQNPTPLSAGWVPSTTPGDVRRLHPDIVHLHWVCGGFVDPPALPRYRRPLIWTLHDQWPFCGAEHYTLAGDERFRTGYSRDNRASGERGLDLARIGAARKARAYARIETLVAVAPSRWLAELARGSRLMQGRQVEIIPYGIDAARFKPIDRRTARDILGWPKNARIILFGALGGVHNPRKGWDLVAAALADARLRQYPELELAIFGSSAPVAAAVPVRPLGTLVDDVALALHYAAADLYLHASLADNLPLTVMEAMACGLPVVAVQVGGVADLVEDGVTGRLVEQRDPTALAAALDNLLEFGERRVAYGRAARARIEAEFTLGRQAERYEALYREVLQRQPKPMGAAA
jgi:glycosyltransferase involved in cell wall biosynthesis